MPSAQVNNFRVVFYGASGGVGQFPASIQLLDGNTTRAHILLWDLPDTARLPEDSEVSGVILMHTRARYLEGLLTVLRGTRPLTLTRYAGGKVALVSAPMAAKTVEEAAQEPDLAQLRSDAQDKLH